MKPLRQYPIMFISGALLLTGCASGGNEPQSIAELQSRIEDSGYSCGEAYDSHSGDDKIKAAECDNGVTAQYFQDPAAEARSFTSREELFQDMPFTVYFIRGDEWHLMSNEDGKSAMEKIADELGKRVIPVGN